jgi:hypothetical protein
MKPKVYEFTPTVTVVPAQPILASRPLDWDEILQKETVWTEGVQTECLTTDGARREADRMLRACRERLRRGDRYALIELLDDNPAFIEVQWVREALFRLLEGGLPLRRRGRIRGKHVRSPHIIRALVELLVARRDDVRNHEEAFRYLEDKGMASKHTIRRLYYQGRQDSRFRPVQFEYPERSFRVPAAEAERFLRRGRILGEGERLTYRGQDPKRGEVELIFEAK